MKELNRPHIDPSQSPMKRGAALRGKGGYVISNFWSIVLDDHWSKKIYRPKMTVWSGAIIHRQPIAVSYISIYICFIDIRSKSKEQLNERRAGLSNHSLDDLVCTNMCLIGPIFTCTFFCFVFFMLVICQCTQISRPWNWQGFHQSSQQVAILF